MYEAPPVFLMAWRAICVFMPESLRGCIHFVTEGSSLDAVPHLRQVRPSTIIFRNGT